MDKRGSNIRSTSRIQNTYTTTYYIQTVIVCRQTRFKYKINKSDPKYLHHHTLSFNRFIFKPSLWIDKWSLNVISMSRIQNIYNTTHYDLEDLNLFFSSYLLRLNFFRVKKKEIIIILIMTWQKKEEKYLEALFGWKLRGLIILLSYLMLCLLYFHDLYVII